MGHGFCFSVLGKKGGGFKSYLKGKSNVNCNCKLKKLQLKIKTKKEKLTRFGDFIGYRGVKQRVKPMMILHWMTRLMDNSFLKTIVNFSKNNTSLH